MKRALTLVLVTLLAAAFFACATRAWAQTSWKQIPIPKLPAFKPAEPKRIELANGMVIFLQEDHELPLIDGTARIRGGERSVPANQTSTSTVKFGALAARRRRPAISSMTFWSSERRKSRPEGAGIRPASVGRA
jgi:hypothetical protein